MGVNTDIKEFIEEEWVIMDTKIGHSRMIECQKYCGIFMGERLM